MELDIEKIESIIEGILFATGRIVDIKEIEMATEISQKDLEVIISNMQEKYKEKNRGIEIIKINNGYQLCS